MWFIPYLPHLGYVAILDSCSLDQDCGVDTKMTQLRSSSFYEYCSGSGAHLFMNMTLTPELLFFMRVAPAPELPFFMALAPASASVRFRTLRFCLSWCSSSLM